MVLFFRVLTRRVDVLTGALGGVFLAGLSMGVTSCAVHCSPVLFYIGGTADGWRSGLKAVLVFAFSRLFGITVLGALAGGFGAIVLNRLAEGSVVSWLRYAASAVIVVLGILVLFGLKLPGSATRMCRAVRGPASQRSLVSMAILGLLIGITPVCPVFIGVLNYVAFGLESVALGALFAFVFGLGSAVMTPLVAMGPLVGLGPRLFSSPARLRIFRRASGVILLALGVALFLAT